MPSRSSIDRVRQKMRDRPGSTAYLTGEKQMLDEALIHHISEEKHEPQWMLELRLRSLRLFRKSSSPSWGPDLSALRLDDLLYYVHPGGQQTGEWEKVPAHIRKIYDHLGVPTSEQRILAGAGAQYESAVIYHRLKERWEREGVIFLSMDDAVREHPDLVQTYFMQCIPPTTHHFAALHFAVWSGGTFLYVPAGVQVREPLQAYFRMNAPHMGQFEHTLVIVEEGASVHYIEGCSAPQYGSSSLHAGAVEIFAKRGSTVRYSSVENWSRNTLNLNTKRALVDSDATMEWVGGNLGSGITMLYPCSILRGEGARCDHFGLAFADGNQWQDVGAKVFHLAPKTSSTVISKSVSVRGGTTVYRGKIEVAPQARDSMASVRCEALLLDAHSHAETVPDIRVRNVTATVSHEAKVGKLSEDDLFYLTSRGLPEEQAQAMIVNGFLEPIVRLLPLEYAVEMNRLIELEMAGAVG
ncbi:MAG: Fe-S cluster assembly protein SufB [Candidatus Peribacteraceae bacterium]|nr:Fe-S cluster assembly protein SufB [Candidatus Peribacteraceae bacterium]